MRDFFLYTNALPGTKDVWLHARDLLQVLLVVDSAVGNGCVVIYCNVVPTNTHMIRI